MGIPYSDPYQRISEGLGTARGVEQGFRQRGEARRLEQKGDAEKAKAEAQLNAEAPDITKKYLMKALSGEMDARTASIYARAEMQGGQQPLPNLPDAGPARAQPPMPPMQAQRGPWAGGYDKGPPPPSQVQFEEDITVRAPAPQRQSSLPAMPGEGELPIRNRDVPTLIQLAGMGNKSAANDIGYLNYLLGRDRLATNQRQFGAMEVHRGIRDDATKANTAEIPTRRQQAQDRIDVSKFNAQTGRGNLDTRRGENFARGAGPSLDIVGNLSGLIRQGMAMPEVGMSGEQYAKEREAEIMEKIPLIGQFAAQWQRSALQEELSPAQREFKRQAKAAMSTFVNSRFGATLTGHELELANMIAGGSLSFWDTLAGLNVIANIAQNKANQYKRLYPEQAEKVGPGGDLPSIQGQLDAIDRPPPDPNAPLAPIDNRSPGEFIFSPFSGGR